MRRHRPLYLPLLFAVLLSLGFVLRSQDEPLVLTARMHHLGNDPTPEWTEAPVDPEGVRLDFTFTAEGRGEATLAFRQRNVNDPWHVEINGQRVLTLKRTEALGEHYHTVPAGVLRAGENTFALVPEVATDDITFGDVRLWERPFRDVLDLRPVEVRVRDAATSEPLPARVTFTTPDDELVEVFFAEELSTAVRPGVVYTSDGTLTAELPPGEYRVYAARGTEWSRVQADVDVTGERVVLALELEREVDTPGFIACDTHVHTLTYSGHGDSSVEERLVTLAGEGVELAVATDHNHNTDYRPLQVEMGLTRWFTPTVGNEVSTPIGHFNAFPLDPADDVPLHESNDIEAIVADCRAKGAQAVILNHPRWPDHERGPYGVCGLDHYTGQPRAEPMTHPYDALELINSQTVEEEPMLLFRDWFALLNAGEDVRGVGSSDSHTVGGVVGQGRTYLASSTDDPAAIDVEEAARSLREGRSSVSMGIFVDVRRAGASVMGATLPVADLAAEGLTARVAAPSWVTPRRLEVFVNGRAVQEVELAPEDGAPFDRELALDYRGHGQDAWVVVVVTGDGVGGPWWPQLNDYTLAASNPVFVDHDGDLAFTSPRDAAAQLVAEHGTDPASVERVLRRVDPATAFHVLDQVRTAYLREAHARALSVGAEAASFHPELGEFLETLDEPR